jgi:hypothetical protein
MAGSSKHLEGRSAHLFSFFQFPQAFVDQVESDMGGPVVTTFPGSACARQPDRPARDLDLVPPAAFG